MYLGRVLCLFVVIDFIILINGTLLRQGENKSVCVTSISTLLDGTYENMNTSLPPFCSTRIEMMWLQIEGDGERTWAFAMERALPLQFPH